MIDWLWFFKTNAALVLVNVRARVGSNEGGNGVAGVVIHGGNTDRSNDDDDADDDDDDIVVVILRLIK